MHLRLAPITTGIGTTVGTALTWAVENHLPSIWLGAAGSAVISFFASRICQAIWNRLTKKTSHENEKR